MLDEGGHVLLRVPVEYDDCAARELEVLGVRALVVPGRLGIWNEDGRLPGRSRRLIVFQIC